MSEEQGDTKEGNCSTNDALPSAWALTYAATNTSEMNDAYSKW